jgi:hypothetical protein
VKPPDVRLGDLHLSGLPTNLIFIDMLDMELLYFHMLDHI